MPRYTDKMRQRSKGAGTPQGYDLHAGVLASDARALGMLFGNIAPMIRKKLRAQFYRVPDAVIADATHDAIVDYAISPTKFKPEFCVPVQTYLLKAARMNIVDELRADLRRHVREEWFAHNRPLGAVSTVAALSTEYDFSERQTMLQRVIESMSVAEQTAVKLWFAGEGPAAIGAALGGSCEDAAAEVKRLKDRVIKRCRRAATL